MPVPFLDLNAHHAPHRAELADAIQQVVDAAAFAGGPFVSRFEADFADYCGTPHAVGVGSGTDALWLALLALGIGPGDEVITVPMTFIATAEAISRTGARPVFVDIEDATFTMDPAHLERAVTPRTKAILPVHLFGQMADMTPILEFARARGIAVIEDAAQAHGAGYDGTRAGSLGAAGCFSFYPGKNLGAFGEAGAVTTADEALADRIRVLRDHGQTRKYHHAALGWNCRMDGIQAAVLQVKLRHLEHHNEQRRLHAAHYAKALAGIPRLMLPGLGPHRMHVHHVYAIRTPDRDSLIAHLESEGIGCGIHYPVPVHLQPAYALLGHRPGSFPVAERCANEFISLPMYPELTSGQIEIVAGAVQEALCQPA
ncbi:MAG: DegT/DnrJ/EryC1/StrS family aminotransferase [Akkermansiaceae bacterium]|nr:DegT/DnrJ/EryC1/StrS family aminotransferase [Akkermansiaceae bacterium]